jgi:hypothetical protein
MGTGSSERGCGLFERWTSMAVRSELAERTQPRPGRVHDHDGRGDDAVRRVGLQCWSPVPRPQYNVVADLVDLLDHRVGRLSNDTHTITLAGPALQLVGEAFSAWTVQSLVVTTIVSAWVLWQDRRTETGWLPIVPLEGPRVPLPEHCSVRLRVPMWARPGGNNVPGSACGVARLGSCRSLPTLSCRAPSVLLPSIATPSAPRR